jgi:hypothetical protein
MFTVEGFRGIVAFIDDPARPVVPVPFAMPIPAFAPPLGIAIRSDLLERSVLDFNNSPSHRLEHGGKSCADSAANHPFHILPYLIEITVPGLPMHFNVPEVCAKCFFTF